MGSNSDEEAMNKTQLSKRFDLVLRYKMKLTL